jgi:hypothetical protein
MFNKISLYEIASFVDYFVVHVFPARMREKVHRVLLRASVEGSVVTTAILTDGADAGEGFTQTHA